MKALKAALPNADAIYFGVQQFNLRMAGENFPISRLKEVVKACHDNDIHAYLTTNILIYENELKELNLLLESAKEAEIDAVIVHDLASILAAKDIGIPFHVSTQCNVSNSAAARFYESLGAKRLNLARECSLEQVKVIKSKLDTTEVEIFVHGAMCSAVSGRCYLSQTIEGTAEKSANRGRCTQPCRRRWRVFDEEGNEFIYDGVRFMNSRDLCMVTYIPEIIATGIDAVKIEGRMRDPYYVHVVSSFYREAIDSHYDGTFTEAKAKKWRRELKKVYNRGITTGFYFKRPTEEDHQHKSATENGHLHENMEIVIMGGKSSDTFFTQRVRDMQMEGKKIIRTKTASKTAPIEITLTLEKPARQGGGDRVYYFTDKTYGKRVEMRKSKKRSSRARKKDFYTLK